MTSFLFPGCMSANFKSSKVSETKKRLNDGEVNVKIQRKPKKIV